MEKLALRPAEVAKALGLGRTRVYELIHSGELPAVRVGGVILVSTKALEQWLADQQPVVEFAEPQYTQPDRV